MSNATRPPGIPPEVKSAADTIVTEIRRLMANRTRPILVALDGPSGAGKSTVALLVAEALGAALIQSDDFFAADISDAEWDTRTPEARAADAIDW
jgi:cytidylate kinase